jgi:redox-sensing transcriptional repressor
VAIAIVTTPASAAQTVVDTAVGAGVKSILNFAPTTVSVPSGVALRQVDLGIELQILSFYQEHEAAAAVSAPVASGELPGTLPGAAASIAG